MATSLFSRTFRSNLTTTKAIACLFSRSFSTKPSSPSLSLLYLNRLRPLSAVNVGRFGGFAGSTVRGMATHGANSSLNDNSTNWSNRPPKETILLDGCDFEHWLVVMEKPEGEPARDEIIDRYIKTLASVVGSEEEARMKIYSVSTRCYFAFGALVDEETSNKLKELPGVRWVLPDSYLDVKNKDYGGEPFINGQAVPYDPKYHEEWIRNNSRANERNRRNDRPRNFDRSRNFERRENMPNREVQNQGMQNRELQNQGMQNPTSNISNMPPNNMPPNANVPPNNMGRMSRYNMGGPPPANNFGGPPPPSNFGGAQPPPSSFGGAQPPSSSFGGAQPPSSSFRGAQPPPPNNFGGGAQPPPSNFGGAQPPPSNFGGAQPPSNFGGAAQPPPSNFGGAQPPSNFGGAAQPPPNNYGAQPPPNYTGGMPQNAGWSGNTPGNMQESAGGHTYQNSYTPRQ